MTKVQSGTVVSSVNGTVPVTMPVGANPLAPLQEQSPARPGLSPARPAQPQVFANMQPQVFANMQPHVFANMLPHHVLAPIQSAQLQQQQQQQQVYTASSRAGPQVSLSPALSQPVKTLVFFDLETTGLPGAYQPVSITELAMVAVDRGHFLKQDKPDFRVTNKLTLCLKPQNYMHPMAEKKSGLNPVLLENQSLFREALPAIRAFLSTLMPPICLLAHNGDKFDFPILVGELNAAASGDVESALGVAGLTCCDTLKAGHAVWPVLPPAPKKGRGSVAASKQNSYALDQLYKRFCGRRSNAHRAEQDCIDLLKVCHSVKAAFVSYVDSSATLLADARSPWRL